MLGEAAERVVGFRDPFQVPLAAVRSSTDSVVQRVLGFDPGVVRLAILVVLVDLPQPEPEGHDVVRYGPVLEGAVEVDGQDSHLEALNPVLASHPRAQQRVRHPADLGSCQQRRENLYISSALYSAAAGHLKE